MKKLAALNLRVIGQGGGMYSTIAQGCSTSSYLVEVFYKLRVLRILLDLGYGTLGSALKMGIDPTLIDIVCLSHFHIDHAADLMIFIHAREKLAWKCKKRLKKLLVYGPDGTEDIFWSSAPLLGDSDFDPDIKFLEGPRKYRKIETIEVYHSSNIQSLATIFRGGYRKIVYTGDLRDDPKNFEALSGRARKADLLITEATGVSDWHLGLEGAIRLYNACKAKYMVLGHVRSDYMSTVQEACRSSNGLFFQALDGATIKI
jgi:ribonuclease BN (tRNA processing enzyme)